MAEIKHFSSSHLAQDHALERIVAAAKADAGLWLMVKEREMEMRSVRSDLGHLGVDASEIDRLLPDRLKPPLSELANEFVSRMFGSCPSEMLARVQDALLDAAKHELDAAQSKAPSTTTEGEDR